MKLRVLVFLKNDDFIIIFLKFSENVFLLIFLFYDVKDNVVNLYDYVFEGGFCFYLFCKLYILLKCL